MLTYEELNTIANSIIGYDTKNRPDCTISFLDLAYTIEGPHDFRAERKATLQELLGECILDRLIIGYPEEDHWDLLKATQGILSRLSIYVLENPREKV